MSSLTVVESLHPTVVVDDEGKIISMNRFAAELLQRTDESVSGWPLEELLGFTIESLLDPPEAEGDSSRGACSTISRFVPRSDGTSIAVEITCGRCHLKSQRFTILHFCDVTERHADRMRLRQLSLALEQIADHAVITDDEGTILYVNRAFEAVTGHSRQSAIGQSMQIIHSGRQGANFYQELWQTIRSGRVFRAEFVNRNALGDLYIDEQSISPFVDEETGRTYYIATGRDVTESRMNDPLTGLPTRAALIERMGQALARAERDRSARPLALAFIDLDRFKNVNDAHGMAGGDQILAEVGKRIRLAVRRVDAVAQVSHLDRDEFAVLLEELRGIEDARRVAQRLLESIREPIKLAEDSTVIVTASIGIASPSEEGTTPETLLRAAETAMHRAKATPDEPCQVLDPSMHERAKNRLRLEMDLRHALKLDQFVLHYQPIVSLETGRITSCEALVRWEHPTRGSVQPLDFIEIAEQTGLIVALGQVVLQQACRQARAWHDLALGPVSIAINVSPRQLIEGRLVESVRQALETYGVAPKLLKIEITESASTSNPEAAAAVLRELKALGVQLLIDDFGTGYSSLSRLTHFPLDKIKIDRSFVKNIPDSGHDTTVASTIVAMAHSLGLKVIAEGVETTDQAAFLSFIGCEEMQGYLFSRPVVASEFERMMREGRKLPLENIEKRYIRFRSGLD